MELKNLPKKIFHLGIFLGVVFYIGLLSDHIPPHKTAIDPKLVSANAGPVHENKNMIVRSSVHLKIPILNVDAVVESVGLTIDGAVDVPKGPSNVAWFNLGPYPGEKGSSVIVGHSGWKNGTPAVFDNLYKLKNGDKVLFQDGQGMVTTFVVREIKMYLQNEEVPSVFISNDDKAHLNLITCTGIWDDVQKGRLNRLIIFTDKE